MSFRKMFKHQYWKLLAAVGLSAFLVSWASSWIRNAIAGRRVVQTVRAAGPLPSFELSRTERHGPGSNMTHDHTTVNTIMARRSDGAEVRRYAYTVLGGKTVIERRLVFQQQGIVVEAHDHTGTMSTFYYDDPNDPIFLAKRLMQHDVSSNCSKPIGGGQAQTPVGDEVVAGVRAFKFIRDGKRYQHTVWLAPSLGCIPIMQNYDWGEAGNPSSSTSFSAPDYLKLSEPDENLFLIPSHYQEMKPSERRHRHIAFLGVQLSEEQRAFGERSDRSGDEAYARRRRK